VKIKYILVIILFCAFVLPAAAAGRPEQVIGLGAGYFGGMPGASIDLFTHIPGSWLGTNDLYSRVGLAVADSRALTPDKDWCRFIPLYIDAVYYLQEDMYIGTGLNYPLKVSENETGNIGYELYLGMEKDTGIMGKIFGEIGCGSLRRSEGDPFEGLQCMIGWRYDAIPAPAAAKAVIEETRENTIAEALPSSSPVLSATQEINALPPSVPVLSVTQEINTLPPSVPVLSVTQETNALPPSIPASTQEINSVTAEIEALGAELIKAQDYVALLDNKIEKATGSGDNKKLSNLNYLKSDAVDRVKLINSQIEEKKAKGSLLLKQGQ